MSNEDEPQMEECARSWSGFAGGDDFAAYIALGAKLMAPKTAEERALFQEVRACIYAYKALRLDGEKAKAQAELQEAKALASLKLAAAQRQQATMARRPGRHLSPRRGW